MTVSSMLYDLGRELILHGIPRALHGGGAGDYERAKDVMVTWRNALLGQGFGVPAYETCIQFITEWVRV
jgi:hypothetical protein